MNRIMPYLLFASFVCLYLLYEKVDAIDRAMRDSQSELHEKIATLEKRMLSRQVEGIDPLQAVQNRQNLTNMKYGLYSAELEVKILNQAKTRTILKEFTLYHVRERVQNEGQTYPINIGIAFSGITSIPLFYIDYDSDGNIDLNIMQEFVYYLPGGRLLAKSIDASKAQAVYDSFLARPESATYYSSERIKDSGSKLSAQLWDFVHDKSKDLASWIESHPSTSGSNQESESDSALDRIEFE